MITEKLDLDVELLQHLVDPESVSVLRDQEFDSKLIVDEGVRAVYDWQMQHLREHHVLATATVLGDEWGITLFPPQTAIGDLIDRMRKRYIRNEGKKSFNRILDDVGSNPLVVGPKMLSEGKRLAELTVKRGKIINGDDYYKLERIYEQDNVIANPPSWGFTELDKHFGGVRGLVFLLARMKSFKSWFTVHAVWQNILKGKDTFLYSLEMPVEHTAGRLACMNANIPFFKWERGLLNQAQQAALKASFEELRERAQFTIEKPQRGSRSVQELLEKALDKEAKMVCIDQLQYVELPNGRSCGSQNNTGDYWDVCEALRDYSDLLPIFCIHQFNRSTLNNHKTDERPDPQQAKGSAAVEETANTMLGLWQNKEMREQSRFEVFSLAARSAVEGAWMVGYDLSEKCQFWWQGPSMEGIEI